MGAFSSMISSTGNTFLKLKRVNYEYKGNQTALFHSKISFDKQSPWFEHWDKNILKIDL